jgi:hypothetical protein
MSSPTSGDYASLEAGPDSSIGMRFYRDGVARAILGDIDAATARRWRVPERPTSSLVLLDDRAQAIFAAPAADGRIP